MSGGARGMDLAGESFAECYGYKIYKFPANWDKFGRKAGHLRNKQMAEFADALLLIWDGYSKGSKNMKSQMVKLNKPIFEVIIQDTKSMDAVNKMFAEAYKDLK